MSDLDSLRTERDALQEAHDRLCAELAEAKAQITKLHHQHTKALALLTEHHADRIRDLGLADAVTRKEFDELERERDRAEHEREQASFRITELEHETEHLTTQLDGCDAEVKRQMEARRIAEAHKALAIRERDAQHALVLKLTAERDEVRVRAEASFDALAKGAREVLCSGPCCEAARCGACLAHANQAGLGRMLERAQNQRDAWAARFASLRAKVEGLHWYAGNGQHPILIARSEVLALLEMEAP